MRCPIKFADVGDGGRFGPNRRRAFVVAAAGQACKALFAEHETEGVDADGMAGLGQFALDVEDRKVAFAQGDDAFADGVAGRVLLRPGAG